MKTCILFGNCHCSGIRKFLELSNFYEQYEIHQFANWELIKDENNMAIPVHLIKNADLVIYQPLSDVHNCYSTNRQNPESFFKLLRDDCTTVSFPRIHNNALFPIFHKTNRKQIFYGGINNKVASVSELVHLYNNDLIDYNFDARMSENYLKSQEKEAECDIKIADFIYNNVSNQKLFLTQDHPTSFVFNELTSRICDHLEIEYDYDKGLATEENITGLKDSVYGRADHQYPVSRYAARHFGFRYAVGDQDDANLFYGNNTVDYFRKGNQVPRK
jgi:Polysaccharide biosynthesis enzyme WcbI